MKWNSTSLRASLVRTLFVVSTIGAMILSAVAEATWG
jgi:hypothetical protein